MTAFRGSAAAAAAFACALAIGPAQADVIRKEATINGFKVDRFIWTDSKGLTRSVSLKREGAGNAGHGGYAVQMTYQFNDGGVIRTVVANPPVNGEGFGYFVSHERFRNFSDGDYATIAGKIFGKDDSPLGRGFVSNGFVLPPSDPTKAAIRFNTSYPRYGTVAATTLNDSGEDSPALPVTAGSYALYQLPVQITWYFQEGADYPRIRTRVSFENVPGPDRVSFDVRGPYGELKFDGAADAAVRQVYWGDRYQFKTLTQPLTRASTWTWKGFNAGGRFTTLTASKYEMGLLEPRSFRASSTQDGYANARGLTSTTYNNGAGCFAGQRLPCDYEWPYQSAQYSLSSPNTPTTGKKIAWGSTAFYGTSLPAVFDTGDSSEPFNGFPASGALTYDICVALDVTQINTVARAASLAGGTYNCADGR